MKPVAVFAAAVILALAVLGFDAPSKPATVGSWQVDARHSDAKLTTDATTDYGKTKMNVILGFARLNGSVTIDNGDPAKSSVEFRFYPATSMSPVIDEDGKFLSHWLENMSNHTLVCFHSKGVVRTPDGRLQATGDLSVTRADRNVDATPSEAYAGPVYGPPMIHRVSREATFVFDLPAADGNAPSIRASGTTSMFREDFPQLVRTVVSTGRPWSKMRSVKIPTRLKPIVVPNAREHSWKPLGSPKRLTQPTPRIFLDLRISMPSSQNI